MFTYSWSRLDLLIDLESIGGLVVVMVTPYIKGDIPMMIICADYRLIFICFFSLDAFDILQVDLSVERWSQTPTSATQETEKRELNGLQPLAAEQGLG